MLYELVSSASWAMETNPSPSSSRIRQVSAPCILLPQETRTR